MLCSQFLSCCWLLQSEACKFVGLTWELNHLCWTDVFLRVVIYTYGSRLEATHKFVITVVLVDSNISSELIAFLCYIFHFSPFVNFDFGFHCLSSDGMLAMCQGSTFLLPFSSFLIRKYEMVSLFSTYDISTHPHDTSFQTCGIPSGISQDRLSFSFLVGY
jgi:hypothetical protein